MREREIKVRSFSVLCYFNFVTKRRWDLDAVICQNKAGDVLYCIVQINKRNEWDGLAGGSWLGVGETLRVKERSNPMEDRERERERLVEPVVFRSACFLCRLSLTCDISLPPSLPLYLRYFHVHISIDLKVRKASYHPPPILLILLLLLFLLIN